MKAEYEFKIYPQRHGYDSRNFDLGDKGRGFICTNGRKALTRCPDCDRENYAAAVFDCVCAWCSFDAKPHIPGEHSPKERTE